MRPPRGFNVEMKSDAPLLASSGPSQDVVHLPCCHRSPKWILAHTSRTPPPPKSISSFFQLPPLSLCEVCLKEHDSIFNLEELGGPSPEGGWQEMKAVHIVPAAFQHYTSVAGSENYPSPCHTPHTVRVCMCVCVLRSQGSPSRQKG